MRRPATHALVVLLLVAPGCGFRERKQQAAFMVKAPSRMREARTARALLTFDLRETVDERSLVQPGATVAPALQRQLRQVQQAQQSQPAAPSLPAGIDFSNGRAALLVAAPGVGEIPVAVWDRTSLFMLRGGRAARRRPWAQLDFADVNARKGPATSPPQASGMSPATLVDLLAGALSGSVKRVGLATVGDVETTHYRLNADWDKALSDQGREAAGLPKLSERRSEALQRVYEQMAISDPIFPSQVWLDERGLVRKLESRIKQTIIVQVGQRRRHVHFLTTIRLELTDFGTPVDIVVPERKSLIQVDGLGELFGELGTPGAPAQQAQVPPGTTPAPPA